LTNIVDYNSNRCFNVLLSVQTYLATLGLAVTNMSVKFEGIYKCAFVPCCPVYCYLDLHVMFLLLLERNKIKK